MGEDTVTLCHTAADKPVCKSVHLLIELTICEDLLIIVFVDEDDERLVAVLPNLHFQQLAQIFLPADDRGIVGIQDLHLTPLRYYFLACMAFCA